MVEHRVAVEADFAGDLQRLRLGLDALELDAVLGSRRPRRPASPPRKSKCHQARRNSPSVTAFSPTASCFFTTSRIARSSTARNSSAPMLPSARAARASFSSGGRSRLPTSSARNGGLARHLRSSPVFLDRQGYSMIRLPSKANPRRLRQGASSRRHGCDAACARRGSWCWSGRGCRHRSSPRKAPHRRRRSTCRHPPLSPGNAATRRAASGSMLACARWASMRSTKPSPCHPPSSRFAASTNGDAQAGERAPQISAKASNAGARRMVGSSGAERPFYRIFTASLTRDGCCAKGSEGGGADWPGPTLAGMQQKASAASD